MGENVEGIWNKKAKDILVGRKITAARYLTQTEAEELGWSGRPLLICLDDGTQLIPQSDDEGNDGGALNVATKKENPVFGLL
jgi:hypothetical protein